MIQTKNLNEPDDAANTLQEAYKAYRKTDPEDAARVLQQASMKLSSSNLHEMIDGYQSTTTPARGTSEEQQRNSRI